MTDEDGVHGEYGGGRRDLGALPPMAPLQIGGLGGKATTLVSGGVKQVGDNNSI